MSSLMNTNAFDYINVLEKAADASWMRNDAIANNLANVDTPGYKRQDVDFETQLAHALKNSRYTSMDKRVANINMSRLNPLCYTDYASFSYRLDGNNVDVDTEGVYLAKNQITYQGLERSIAQEFKNLQTVMK